MEVATPSGYGNPEPCRCARQRPALDVVFYRCGDLRWRVRPAVAPDGLAKLLTAPDSYLIEPALRLADSDLITMARVEPRATGVPTLLLRRLNYGRWRHRLRDLLRPTRAERAFEAARGLEAAGVATARAVAVGVERVLCWPVRAYLLTEWVAHAVTLEAYLARHQGLSTELLHRLADLLARLHEGNFSHRDLRSSNVLFDARLQPCLIDLDGVRHYQRLPRRRAVADLARLAWEFLPYPQEMQQNSRRFLARYCQQRGLAAALDTLENQVNRELNRRIARKGRFTCEQRDQHLRWYGVDARRAAS